MAANNQPLTLRLVGDESDDGMVRLEHFSKLCDSLRQCLRHIENDITHKRPAVQYKIVDLKCESALVAVEPVRSNGRTAVGREVIEVFKKTVRGLQRPRPRIDDRIEVDTLQAFRKLYEPILKAPPSSHRSLRVDDVVIDATFIANINKLSETPIKSLGSVAGRMERLNLHNKREFFIWTPLHNSRVTCEFSPELIDQVREGIDRQVTVFGTMYYQAEKPYPIRARVRALVVNRDDDELPTLSELRGTVSAKQDSVSAVRAIRDEY